MLVFGRTYGWAIINVDIKGDEDLYGRARGISN